MVESSENKVLTFIHRFSRTLSCELQIPAAPPAPGQLLLPTCCWSGRPKPKHIPAYRQWALLVHQNLADQWQQRILYGLGTAPNWTELWCFEPGGTPKLLQKIPVGIP
ncbi:MAG: hypothetical protein WB586_19235 [Chthoniobacterales bacterium]